MDINFNQGLELLAQKNPIPGPLITSLGRDFYYSDRNRSMQILADSLLRRMSFFKENNHDKSFHPIPYVADGPGTGKSRFLQELFNSFESFVLNSDYPMDFKEFIKNCLYINISFGNGCNYSKKESDQIDIAKSLAIRIIYNLKRDEFNNFDDCYRYYEKKSIDFSEILTSLGKHNSVIILCIDEINQVYGCNLELFSNKPLTTK
jgi:hypothetical protein